LLIFLKEKLLFDKTQFWKLAIYMEDIFINIKIGIVVCPGMDSFCYYGYTILENRGQMDKFQKFKYDSLYRKL